MSIGTKTKGQDSRILVKRPQIADTPSRLIKNKVALPVNIDIYAKLCDSTYTTISIGESTSEKAKLISDLILPWCDRTYREIQIH
jgi:hypothetical protein